MRRLILSILFFTTSITTYGSMQPDTVSFKMDEVVITATRTPLMLKDTPVITRVISSRELKRRGISTMQQALEQELAGVEFHQAGYGSSMSFQGLDARYILFLVDGERLAGETYGNVDYARIPLETIDRIEIVRGASSVLYGSNAMGAVVNIITKMPTQKAEINVSARYGTPFQNNGSEPLGGNVSASDTKSYRNRLDLPNLKGDLSAGFNFGKLKSLTSVSYRTIDAYKLVGTKDEIRHYKTLTSVDTGKRPPVSVEKDVTKSVAPDQRGLSVSGWRDINVGQRFDYEVSESFKFSLSGNYFNKNRYDFNGNIMDENPMANNSKPWAFESYQGYNIKAQMEHSPNKNNKIYLSFVRDEYFRNLDSLSGITLPKQRHTYNTPRLLWTLKAGKYNRLTTGLEMINEQLLFDLNPLGYHDLKSLNTASAYVQDEITTNIPLSFVVGLRADYSSRFGWSATPKASLKYTLNKFSFRANYSSGYRTPSLKEMYMEFTVPIPGQMTVIRGNENLRPETNHYVSLSGEYNIDGFNASITLYNSYLKNKIDVRGHNEGQATILQYQNINRSKFGGVEFMTRVRVAQGLFVKANYNYIYQTDDAPEGSTQYIFPSPHTATLQADYGFNAWKTYMNLNANVKYTGPKNYEDFMTVFSQYPDPKVPGKMNTVIMTGTYTSHHTGYAVCNASFNVQLPQMVNLTIGVDNIFNYRPSVINFNSAITPMRNMFIKASYSFGAN